MAGLVFKRRLHVDAEGFGRLSLPKELNTFLGLKSGGPVAVVVDTKASIPTLILRKDVEED